MWTTNVHDVLLFHRRDREYYDKILTSGRNPAVARNILALWMWLEMTSIDVFARLKDNDDELELGIFIAEAEIILSFLRPDAVPPPPNVGIPLTASLVSGPLDLRFFFFHSETVARGMTCVLDGVGRLIFNDALKSSMDLYGFRVRDAVRVPCPLPTMPVQLARQYMSRPVDIPEDYRALFVTFSNGLLPLSREEVVQYFTEKLGDCIESVRLEVTSSSTISMFGRIVFKREPFIGLLLNGQHMVNFTIKGREMRARKYASD